MVEKLALAARMIFFGPGIGVSVGVGIGVGGMGVEVGSAGVGVAGMVVAVAASGEIGEEVGAESGCEAQAAIIQTNNRPTERVLKVRIVNMTVYQLSMCLHE